MRTIKFRAWDKEKGGMSRINAGIIWNIIENNLPISERGRWELMQFTGLTDKNGKEIYEGDIIAEGEDTYEVKWYHGGFGLRSLTSFEYDNDILWGEDGEVIGNIYENPELMINT